MKLGELLLVFSCLLAQNLAQVQQQECMNELQPCINYINGNSNPPDSCCRPLSNVIRSMPECLCSFMSIQGANQAEQAGINTTEAQTLPGRCGQHINPLGCVTGTPDTRSRNTPDTRSRNSVPNNSAGSKFQLSSLIVAASAASIILSF